MKLKSSTNNSSGAAATTPGSSNPLFSFKNDEEQLLTSVNLESPIRPSRLTSTSSDDSDALMSPNNQTVRTTVRKKRPAIIDSDEEDSAESSGDEYVHTDFSSENENLKLVETANTSKKLLNIVTKIAASNYFQKATENKYIKMAMENVSNCQLNLNVQVKKISGTIALNIPAHPSDRIWYN